jgi:hypothetical protein
VFLDFSGRRTPWVRRLAIQSPILLHAFCIGLPKNTMFSGKPHSEDDYKVDADLASEYITHEWQDSRRPITWTSARGLLSQLPCRVSQLAL